MSDLLTYWAMLGRYMDGNLRGALANLSDEQWHAMPAARGNSIAFIAWHYFRTEDNIINWIIRDRQPTVWMQGGWSERLGLPRVAQGTGMPVTEAQALRIGDLAAFMEYVRQVRAGTDAFLPTWDPADYDTVITLKPVGQMTKLQSLAQQALPHGFAHLGEISHIRAMLGLPGFGL